MPDYSIFGGVLRSNIPLPSLPPARRSPTHQLTAAGGEPPSFPGVELGSDLFEGGATVRSFRSADGEYRIVYEGLGTFDITDGGRTIRGYLLNGTRPEVVRLCLIGRVFALALHAEGFLTLHGSAVSVGGGAIALLAPSGTGKSTLAMSLVKAGAALLGDDSIPVSPGPPVLAHPGVSTLRLNADSTIRLGLGGPDGDPAAPKTTYADLPVESVASEPAPLQAVYLLSAADPSLSAVERRAVRSAPATYALIRNGRMGSLLSGADSVAAVRRAAEVAARVPVYELPIPRSFGRLPEVVDNLLDWMTADRVNRS